MENLIFKIVEYNFGIIVLLFIIKVVHFFLLKSKRKTFVKFIFFNDNNMYLTKDLKKKKHKRIQNLLSILIALLLLSQVFIFMSTVFFRNHFES